MGEKRVGWLALGLAAAIVVAIGCRPVVLPPSSTTTTTTTTPCAPATVEEPTTTVEDTTTTVEDTTTTVEDTTTTEEPTTTVEDTTTTVEDTTTTEEPTTTVEDTTTTVEDTTTTVEDTTTTVEDTTTTVEDTTTTVEDTTTLEETSTTTLPPCEPTTSSTTATTGASTSTTSESTTTTLAGDAPFAGMNILWVQSDDQTCSQQPNQLCDSIRAFMPWLRSKAGGGGDWFTFTQARTHNSVCCPNRATALTGQTSFHNHVLSNSECAKYSENGYLPLALQQGGYRTAITGKYLNCFSYPSKKWPVPPTGWDFARIHNGDPAYYGFDVVHQDGTTEAVAAGGPETWEPYWMRDRAVEWLDSVNAQDPDQPWFLYYTPYAPHAPAAAPPDYQESYSSVIPTTPDWREGCTPGNPDPITDKPSFIQAYPCKGNLDQGKGALWGLDAAFASIYDHLEATGELENTIILFTSDNGVGLGSHRVTGKTCAYERCHAIPFLLRLPGLDGGLVPRMVSNLDIYSTLTDLVGAPVLRHQDGRSIRPLLSDPAAPWRDEQFLWNKSEGYSALREDCAAPGHTSPDPCWLLTEYLNGEIELYDLNADPWQLTQLLPNPVTGYPGVPGWTLDHPTVVDLRARLVAAYGVAGAAI